MIARILTFVKKYNSDIILLIGIILIALIAYASGFLNAFEKCKPEIEIYEKNTTSPSHYYRWQQKVG